MSKLDKHHSIDIGHTLWYRDINGWTLLEPLTNTNFPKPAFDILSIKSDEYPIGTQVTIIWKEPKHTKQIILPKGMEWVDHYDKQYDMLDSTKLFTIDGLKIAQVFNTITDDYYCTCVAPWDRELINFYKKTLEEGKEEVLKVCARNNWYGIKKL